MVHVIPRIYPQPGGGPLYWRDEESGALRLAFDAYLDHCLDKQQPAPTAEQFALLRDYCDYWIHAPCWRSLGQLDELRDSIKHVLTVAELRDWLWKALEEGIDPL
jgi:hypothetical protein